MDHWSRLCRAVQKAADLCAESDPAGADLYRQEAEAFCRLLPPIDDRELACLRQDADALQKRWSSRLAGTERSR